MTCPAPLDPIQRSQTNNRMKMELTSVRRHDEFEVILIYAGEIYIFKSNFYLYNTFHTGSVAQSDLHTLKSLKRLPCQRRLRLSLLKKRKHWRYY